MIYGLIFAATLFLVAFTHELIPLYYVLLGGMVCMAIVAIVNMQSAKKTKSTPASVAPAPGTSPGSPARPTPTAPAPVPKTNWVWPVIVGILAIVVIIWIIAPMMTKLITSPPQVAAPKKELKQYTKSFPLQFLGAEHVIERGPGWVKIQKEKGRANFLVANIPVVKGARYKITFHGTREKTGRDYFLINAGKGNYGRPFFYKNHPASDSPMEITLFKEGMAGNSEYFYPTDNFIQLSADEDLLVQLDQQPYVEITYWQ